MKSLDDTILFVIDFVLHHFLSVTLKQLSESFCMEMLQWCWLKNGIYCIFLPTVNSK